MNMVLDMAHPNKVGDGTVWLVSLDDRGVTGKAIRNTDKAVRQEADVLASKYNDVILKTEVGYAFVRAVPDSRINKDAEFGNSLPYWIPEYADYTVRKVKFLITPTEPKCKSDYNDHDFIVSGDPTKVVYRCKICNVEMIVEPLGMIKGYGEGLKIEYK